METNISSTVDEHLYTIKEVSEKLGISQHTLRYYEKDGLIPHVTKGENGRRLYNQTDITWIQVVQCLRKTGMSVSHIKEYNRLTSLGKDTISQRKELVLRQREIIEMQIKEYQDLLRIFDLKLQYFDQYMEATEQLID